MSGDPDCVPGAGLEIMDHKHLLGGRMDQHIVGDQMPGLTVPQTEGGMLL